MNELIKKLENLRDVIGFAIKQIEDAKIETTPEAKAFHAMGAMEGVHLAVDEYYANTESFVIQMQKGTEQ